MQLAGAVALASLLTACHDGHPPRIDVGTVGPVSIEPAIVPPLGGFECKAGQLEVKLPSDGLFKFPFDSSELSPAARSVLAALAETAMRFDPTSVTVQGHTDGVGTVSYNNQLSMRRAVAVVSVLKAHGLRKPPPQPIPLGERGARDNVRDARQRYVKIIVTPRSPCVNPR